MPIAMTKEHTRRPDEKDQANCLVQTLNCHKSQVGMRQSTQVIILGPFPEAFQAESGIPGYDYAPEAARN